MKNGICNMELEQLGEYAELFTEVFNAEPWNDSWTKELSAARIKGFMTTSTFLGKAIYADGELKGIIFGQKEQYFNGMHFQIQEFCVRTDEQKKGYGSALLEALERELDEIGAVNIFLITSKGERTEGYYSKKGFQTSDFMVLMTNGDFKKNEPKE